MEFDAFADGKSVSPAVGADAAVLQRGHPGRQHRYERIGFRSVKKHQRLVNVPDALGPGRIIACSRIKGSQGSVSCQDESVCIFNFFLNRAGGDGKNQKKDENQSAAELDFHRRYFLTAR